MFKSREDTWSSSWGRILAAKRYWVWILVSDTKLNVSKANCFFEEKKRKMIFCSNFPSTLNYICASSVWLFNSILKSNFLKWPLSKSTAYSWKDVNKVGSLRLSELRCVKKLSEWRFLRHCTFFRMHNDCPNDNLQNDNLPNNVKRR